MYCTVRYERIKFYCIYAIYYTVDPELCAKVRIFQCLARFASVVSGYTVDFARWRLTRRIRRYRHGLDSKATEGLLNRRWRSLSTFEENNEYKEEDKTN
jgi:hypothetical protein